MKSTDFKNEEFSQYLEEHGITNSITKALLELYEIENKPANVMRFLIESMMDQETAKELKDKDEELASLRVAVDELKKENQSLKEKIEETKSENDEANKEEEQTKAEKVD